MAEGPFFISVIIPVFNGERFLGEAIASIRRQDYQPLEIIIVDDGSTDGTRGLVNQLGEDIRYAYQPNLGPSAARNLGLKMARGEVFAFLDADDLWPEGKLNLQTRRLAEDATLDVVLGRVKYFGLFTAVELGFRFETPEKTTFGVHLGCGLYRRRAFERVGNFDEGLQNYEDHDWFLRARELGIGMLILKQVTLLYRLHEDNLHRTPSYRSQLPLVLKKAVERRRRTLPADLKLRKLIDYDEDEHL